MAKLAIVGAGSSYTPLLIDHILNSGLDQAVSEICLMDIDAGRLKAVHGFTQTAGGKVQVESWPLRPRSTLTKR
jgi:alpha-galactosidase/6-phospho-beta-glucosidase family protein